MSRDNTDGKIVYSPEDIWYMVNDLVFQISYKIEKCDLQTDDILYLCIMKGAVPFFTDVTRRLPSGFCAYIKASSYGDGQVSGKLELDASSLPDKEFKYILIFDDICETGNTLKSVTSVIQSRFKNAKVETCTLIRRICSDYVPTYVGIDTSLTAFFAGYGLDNKGYDRNLPYIYDCSEN